MRVRSLAVLPLLFVVAACAAPVGAAPGGSSGTAPGSPATSASPATAACPAAPAPGSLPDWQPPATAPVVVPVIVSSQQACGQNRFVFSLLDAKNTPIAAPDRTAHIAFYNLGRDGATPTSQADPTFVWAIEGSRGVYVTSVTFPESGTWGAAVTTAAGGGAATTIRMVFDVLPKATTLGVGDRAPAEKTPTLADVGGDISKLATDPSPEADLYKVSIADAIAAGKPFVVAFATPKFCTSGQCGPTLDRVKSVRASFPDVTFINVEPYKLEYANGQLQPVLDANGQLQPVKAVNDWGLLSEPWIFVVDRTGIITGSFEGVVGTDELSAAIKAVE